MDEGTRAKSEKQERSVNNTPVKEGIHSYKNPVCLSIYMYLYVDAILDSIKIFYYYFPFPSLTGYITWKQTHTHTDIYTDILRKASRKKRKRKRIQGLL